MTNKEIASAFKLLAALMELHGGNPFKIKSYQSAYLNLRKSPVNLAGMQESELESIKGIGKAISGKITELVSTGKIAAIEELLSQTPEGIVDMLDIRGFGPKKISVIWKELGAESVGELLYACNENRLIELKGFGRKTQEDLKQKLEYYQKTKDQFLYADIESTAYQLVLELGRLNPGARIELSGSLRRRCNVIDRIEILAGIHEGNADIQLPKSCTNFQKNELGYTGKLEDETPFRIFVCHSAEFGSKQFRYTASKVFMDAFLQKNPGADFRNLENEQEVFAKANLPWIEPELRENGRYLTMANLPELLDLSDIKGVIHTHTTSSDGVNNIREMANHARLLGYNYIGITDHSKSAFYASGMNEEKVRQQWQEIDHLNQEFHPFRIFKGIESDILADGSLDFDDDILAGFDFVIASIHSNLRMTEEKATERLLRAIENPFTSILGHMTGRLLLSRPGYPVEHKKIIDACAANHVAIELNANPYRLDMDWTWIPQAIEKGVLIAINPDAHSIAGISDIKYGVLSARKGGLEANRCLCSFGPEDFLYFCRKRRSM